MAELISTNDSLDHNFMAGSVYYWQYYGLTQSPFEEASSFTMYYPTPSLQEHLNYLSLFCRGDQPLLLIQGELGAGKTTLISQFLSQLDPNISHYEIKARETISAAEFANQIALGFQLPVTLDQSTLRERLDTELQALQLEQKTAILVIEDADLLPIESWVALTHLALAQLGKSINLYMVLTSESPLQNQIQQFALEQGQSFHVPMLQLMPLSFQETQNYVKHRLIKSGLSEKMPFTKEMMQRIYELSDGIPGRINRVAQQMLIEMLKPDEERLAVAQNQRSKMRFLWSGHAVKFVSGILLALVLLTLLRFRGGEDFIHALQTTTKHTAPVIVHNTIASDDSSAPTPATSTNYAANQATPAASNAPTNTVAAKASAINNNSTPTQAVTNSAAPADAIAAAANQQTTASANAPTATQNGAVANANNVTANQNTIATTSTAATAANSKATPDNAPVTTLQSPGKGPSTTLTIPPESTTDVTAANATAAPANNNSPVNSNNVSNAAATMANNTATQPAPVAENSTTTPAASNNATAATTNTAVLAQNQAATTTDNTQVDAQSATTTPKEEHRHASPHHSGATANDISASEHRLLQMQGYTLQIIGARDAVVLQQVMRETGLSSGKTHEFRTRFANKPWYVLVYGNYASSAEAKAAIKELPRSAQQLKPWIRPLSSVHAAIKQR